MDGDETTFERRVREAEAALDSLPVPDPPSSRQIIIAARRKILEKVKSHGWRAVHATFVEIGHDITIETFKDYVYKGGLSKPGRTAERERTKRKAQKADHSLEQSTIVLAPEATQATAGGKPVVAHKVI